MLTPAGSRQGLFLSGVHDEKLRRMQIRSGRSPRATRKHEWRREEIGSYGFKARGGKFRWRPQTERAIIFLMVALRARPCSKRSSLRSGVTCGPGAVSPFDGGALNALARRIRKAIGGSGFGIGCCDAA